MHSVCNVHVASCLYTCHVGTVGSGAVASESISDASEVFPRDRERPLPSPHENVPVQVQLVYSVHVYTVHVHVNE